MSSLPVTFCLALGLAAIGQSQPLANDPTPTTSTIIPWVAAPSSFSLPPIASVPTSNPLTVPAPSSTPVSARPMSWDHVNCFGSGSWARTDTLAFAKQAVCSQLDFSVVGEHTQKLNYSVDAYTGTPLVNEGGDPMTYWVTFDTASNTGPETAYNPSLGQGLNVEKCQAIMGKLIDESCQGKNQDTQGGTVVVKGAAGFPIAFITGDVQSKCGKGEC